MHLKGALNCVRLPLDLSSRLSFSVAHKYMFWSSTGFAVITSSDSVNNVHIYLFSVLCTFEVCR